MTTASHRLHGASIGEPGSRAALNTPALVLDLDAFEANVLAMAAWARERGVALRPHAKTHKSAHVARAQLAAGAVGLCCAKLGEAEALAAEGVTGLHITSPVVAAPAVARLAALHARAPDLSVVADHPTNIAALAAALPVGGPPLRVLVDVDPGIHRTGVASAEAALALARLISKRPSLSYAGVQFYCGVQQHIASYAERRAAIEDRTAFLSTVLRALADAGLPAPLITGGGTGTHRIDADLGVLTELQVGSYVFMDREYGDCDLDGSGPGGAPFHTALAIDATVVSANTPGLATLDAGLKAFAADAGPPPILAGAAPGSRYRFMGDEHGLVMAPPGGSAPPLGARVSLAAPHCDPTVNLYDALHVVRGDALVDIWPVTARGRSA